MRNIGYRIRLPTKLNEQEEFISRYSCYFNTFEVKVKDNIICTSCIKNIVMLTKRYLITVPSFHIIKDALYNQISLEKSKIFIKALKEIESDLPIFLVTHYLPKKVYNSELSKEINNSNFILALENIEVNEDILDYLDGLKCTAAILGAKVCLDIGHLLFSISKCKENETQILGKIANDTWWKENVVEIHLHDFDLQGCHLNIGKGNIDFRLIAPFINLFPNVSIILETTIDDLSVQGIAEVETLIEELAKYDNMRNF